MNIRGVPALPGRPSPKPEKIRTLLSPGPARPNAAEAPADRIFPAPYRLPRRKTPSRPFLRQPPTGKKFRHGTRPTEPCLRHFPAEAHISQGPITSGVRPAPLRQCPASRTHRIFADAEEDVFIPALPQNLPALREAGLTAPALPPVPQRPASEEPCSLPSTFKRSRKRSSYAPWARGRNRPSRPHRKRPKP